MLLVSEYVLSERQRVWRLESSAKFKLEKGEPLCKEAMEQGRSAKGLGQVALAAQAKAERVVPLRQGRAETAYA